KRGFLCKSPIKTRGILHESIPPNPSWNQSEFDPLPSLNWLVPIFQKAHPLHLNFFSNPEIPKSILNAPLHCALPYLHSNSQGVAPEFHRTLTQSKLCL